jgi:hypothetical protein
LVLSLQYLIVLNSKKEMSVKYKMINRTSIISGCVAVILLYLLSSCTPRPIDLEIPQIDIKPVISSQIIPHQTMFISLTRSFSALSNATTDDNQVNADFLEKLLIKDAFVTVSYLGEIDTLQMIAPGIYGSANTLQYEYGNYTLYARDPETGHSISATTQINPLVKFDTLGVILNKMPQDTDVVISYSFHDIPGISNWYVINYYVKQDTSIKGANLNIVNYFEQGSKKLNEFELLSDKLFEGGVYTGSRTLHKLKATDTLAITLSNISEGYFDFLHTYLNSGNVINQISGEPINYPTNVQNGYGYFSAHYPNVRIIYLDKY